MSFPAYERYRDIHVDGFGPIPTHWGLSRLGYESWVRARLGWKGLKADEYVDDGYPLLATPDIKNREIDFDGANRITLERYDESPEIKIAPGDILLAKDGSTLGTVNIVRSLPRPATVNSSLAVITPHATCYGPFLFFYFQSNFVRSRIDQLKGGMGVPHLFQDDLNRFPLPLPPLPEQIAIAAFLDRETAKIDALVEAQRGLIELLKEKRQAVISHAVTKGLDPSAPMKDAGVEWLGQVPAHWEVAPLGYRYEVQLGRMLNAERAEGPDMRPYLRVFDVQWGKINVDDLPLMDFPLDAQSRYRLAPGDLLVNEGGSYVGRSAIWRGELAECYYQKALHRVRPYGVKRDTTDYLFFVMDFATRLGVFVAGGNHTTIDHLTAEQLREYRFAFPPLDEQLAISKSLSTEIEKLDGLLKEAEAAIALLQERRAALISAIVTGKIDVRVQTPIASADQDRVRLLVVAAVVERLAHRQNFGRVKLQKLVYLAETHIGIGELNGSYLRAAAGPLDRVMIEQMEVSLEQSGHFAVRQAEGRGGQVSYRVLGARGAFRDETRAVLKEREARLIELVDMLADLDTKSTEAVATLYAAWNDLLQDDAVVSDDAIASEVLTNWHPEKAQKFKRAELVTWLQWMRRRGLMPRGAGPRTTTGRLFV